jgi:hypothetical protein
LARCPKLRLEIRADSSGVGSSIHEVFHSA